MSFKIGTLTIYPIQLFSLVLVTLIFIYNGSDLDERQIIPKYFHKRFWPVDATYRLTQLCALLARGPVPYELV